MQNDYLNNKKRFNQNLSKSLSKEVKNFTKINYVDINKLLNRVKTNEQKFKQNNLIKLGLVITVISLTGIFVTLT
tara:strand:- start:266 stop:490 length:225 start_codon:yes stop_codon:yes gene_type:complete